MTTTTTFDLRAAFKSAGYDAGTFTADEQEQISSEMEKLIGSGRSKEQAVSVAISMCVPSKAKGSRAGSFGAVMDGIIPEKTVPTKIKIRGGNYGWHNDQDGYFTIFDVPIMSTIMKGVKDAPYDVDEAELKLYVMTAQERYQKWGFCATAFVNHNKDLEFQKPEFCGYVLPNRVGIGYLEDETGKMVPKSTVFADLKVNKVTFDRINRGELPYHSPEVPWAKRRISGLAFLDTKPPFFEFANLTLGDEVKDLYYANFSGVPVENIKREAVGKFDGEADGDGSTQGLLKKLMGRMDAFEAEAKARYSAFEGQFAALKKKFEGEAEAMADTKVQNPGRQAPGAGAIPTPGTTEPVLKGKAEGEGDGDAAGGKSPKKGTFSDETPTRKPTPLPVEPATKVAAMELDARFIAQFEATQSRLQVLEDERAKEKDELLKKARMDWARNELKGKIISATFDSTMSHVVSDETKFKAIVAEMKKSLPSEPPTSMADFKGTAVDASAPSVAAFAQQGPEAAEKAAKFAAQFRTLKASPAGKYMQATEESYVKFQMESAKGLSA